MFTDHFQPLVGQIPLLELLDFLQAVDDLKDSAVQQCTGQTGQQVVRQSLLIFTARTINSDDAGSSHAMVYSYYLTRQLLRYNGML